MSTQFSNFLFLFTARLKLREINELFLFAISFYTSRNQFKYVYIYLFIDFFDATFAEQFKILLEIKNMVIFVVFLVS